MNKPKPSAAQFAARILNEIAKARRAAGKIDLANSATKMANVLLREDRQRRQMERAIVAWAGSDLDTHAHWRAEQEFLRLDKQITRLRGAKRG